MTLFSRGIGLQLDTFRPGDYNQAKLVVLAGHAVVEGYEEFANDLAYRLSLLATRDNPELFKLPGGSMFSSRVRAAATRAWAQRVPVLFADVSLRPVDRNIHSTQSVYFTDWGSRDWVVQEHFGASADVLQVALVELQ